MSARGSSTGEPAGRSREEPPAPAESTVDLPAETEENETTRSDGASDPAQPSANERVGNADPSPQPAHEPLPAVGVVLLAGWPAGDRPNHVAVVQHDGLWTLPRVLRAEGESSQALAQDTLRTQVHPALQDVELDFLVTLEGQLFHHSLRTEYWRALATADLPRELPRAEWMPLAQARTRLLCPEERLLLERMHDPLAHPPTGASGVPLASPGTAASGPPPPGPGQFASAGDPVATPSPSPDLQPSSEHAQRTWELDPLQGDWRSKVRQHLVHAQRSLNTGREGEANDAWMAAWKLELESRSVTERRLITKLLQGEVRARTQGWRRDALLTALEEDPDAGTLARVRAEVETFGRRMQQRRERRRLARLVQIVIAVPFFAALYFAMTQAWLAGAMPPAVEILPAVLGLGMLGGWTWSLLRQVPEDALQALAPLGVGLFGAFFGFLLMQSGVIAIGTPSAPWALCSAFLWGFAGAVLLEFRKRTNAPG